MARISDALVSAFVKATSYKEKKPAQSYVFGVARNNGDKSVSVKINGNDEYIVMRSSVKVKDGDKVAVMIKNRTPLITANLTTPSVNNPSLVGDGFVQATSYVPSGGVGGDDILIAAGEDEGVTYVDSLRIFSNPRPRVLSIGGTSDTTTGTKVKVAALEYLELLNVSDERLKFQIADTKESKALEKINSIKHREYKWRADGRKVKIGYIAQELGKIDPELETKGTTCGVNLTYLIPLMTKAIQDLSAEVEELKGEINELKYNSESSEE